MILCLDNAGGAGVQGREPGVETRDMVDDVLLTHDGTRISFQFSHQGLFFPYAMEIKKNFRAGVSVPEPIG